MKTKKKQTEIQIIDNFLKKEGFSEITDKEKKSKEFRNTLKEFRKKKVMKTGN